MIKALFVLLLWVVSEPALAGYSSQSCSGFGPPFCLTDASAKALRFGRDNLGDLRTLVDTLPNYSWLNFLYANAWVINSLGHLKESDN